MARRLTDMIEVAAGQSATSQPRALVEGAQQGSKRLHGEPRASHAAPGRRNGGTGCSHYWIIESAVGPTSNGTCIICGEERVFRNYLEASEVTPTGLINDERKANESWDQMQHREYHPFLLPRSKYGRNVIT